MLAYVGHAEEWTRHEVEGSLEDQDAKVTYYEGERAAAVLTLFRDRESLRTEAAWEAEARGS